MARLLCASGVLCGHEQVFTVHTASPIAAPVLWGDYDADASWLAVPRLPMLGVPVLTVVRHPLAVVSSMVRLGTFGADRDQDPYTSVVYRWRPEVRRERTVQDRALAAWLHLTLTAVSCADMTVRLETVDATVLAQVLRRFGGRTDDAEENAGKALATVKEQGDDGRNAKTGEKRGVYATAWGQHRTALAGMARDVAASLGYDPDRVP